MGQRKGQTGNPFGRPKGTPNKVTGSLREWINTLIESNREQLEKDFAALEPRERLMLADKLMAYIIPKKREEEKENDSRSDLIRRMCGIDDDE